MRVCIVGPANPGETEIALTEAAKKRYSKVLYAPFSRLRIEMVAGEPRAFYKE